MKRIVMIFSVLFIALSSFGQVIDDFSSGILDTKWVGNRDSFTVNASYQLQSNTGIVGANTKYYLSTPSTYAAGGEWHFFVNLKLATSGQNHIDFYLTSDKSDLTRSDLNGYFVRIGDGAGNNTGRRIVLFKVVSGTASALISSENNLVSSITNNPFFIKVKRTSENEWTLYYNKTGWNDPFTLIGSVTNSDIASSSHTGILIIQNATESMRNNHFFDDVYAGPIIVDTTPPAVSDISISANNQITITFSEAINSVDETNFSLSGVGVPSSAVSSTDGTIATLTFANDFPSGSYTLTMNNITDLAGNELQILSYPIVIPEKVYLVQDDFSDGDFTNNPTWGGNTDSFEVSDVDGNNMLHSINQTASAKFYLSTPSNVVNNCEWDFDVQLHFATSSNNYIDFYLISDKPDLSATDITGYLIRVGDPKDGIHLYKRNGSTTLELIKTVGENITENSTLKIKIIRQSDNSWSIAYDKTGTGRSFVAPTLSAAESSPILTGSYLGVYVVQSTSSFFEKHYFDNIYAGPIIPDTTPPTVTGVALDALNQIAVSFSEAVNPISTSNFNLSGIGAPSEAILSADGLTATLTFANDLPVGSYTLSMNNITDLAGNPLQTVDYQVTVPEKVYLVQDNFSDGDFTNNPTWSGDVELFTIEDEMLKLNTNQNKSYLSTLSSVTNDCEWDFWTNIKFDTSDGNYTDIYLMSNKQNLLATDITGYFVRIGSKMDNISLYKIVKGDTTVIIRGVNKVSGTSNNFIRVRVIRKSDNSWEIRYDPAGGSAFINGGIAAADASPILNSFYMGVAATVTSSNFSKIYYDNFYAGQIIPDTTPPDIQSVVVNTANTKEVKVIFTEGVQPLTTANFTLLTGEHPTSVTLSTTDASVTLTFANGFIPKQHYKITVTDLIDLDGNVTGTTEYTFGVAEYPVVGDLIINEIMFNNPDGAEEYVEVYNKSDKILDVSGILFGPKKADGTISSKAIPNGTIMLPYTYLALCKTPDIERNYFQCPDTANLISMPLTALSNEGATIVLYKDVNIFDELTYSSKWHNPMVKNQKGVALERINPDMPSNSSSSWTSAAAPHYGTPGYKNSQYTDITSSQANKEVWIDDEVFTPNGDGDKDMLVIHYQLNEPGWVANITIFDASGMKVKKYPSNTILATEGVLTWDGSTDSGKLANIGIYVVYLDMFNKTTGGTKRFKLAAVVSGSR